MAKKQVAVSLRKPPSPEKVDAFVAGGEGGAPAHDAVKSRPATDRRAHDDKTAEAKQERAPEARAPEARAPEAPPSAEPPPSVAPPPQASAAAEPQALATTAEPPAVPPVLVGNDGRARRAVTVYLPDPLADRLLLHCIEHDRDVSNLVGEAVEVHLDRRLGPAPVSAAPAAGGAAAAHDAAPPGPSYRAEPFRAEPFRAADTRPKGRVGRMVQVGRVLMTLWRQRPRAS
ncbi:MULTISPECIES: hypothetical protein [Sorangium]|uniref:Uncharacterized protein n=1 Tax=Sorangium cellulosum TaxID=56 RepID=A0A4P2R2Z9_SORCE|nr:MULTISPECIES: hypothetical protein [Sorangium]AUX37076.1 hypothetical protein SOCE836_092950 [Sorangium cellulosum]WCQ96369.1 hypothetical protein NQZ70_09155 [Sorangium sp. Soce836]